MAKWLRDQADTATFVYLLNIHTSSTHVYGSIWAHGATKFCGQELHGSIKQHQGVRLTPRKHTEAPQSPTVGRPHEAVAAIVTIEWCHRSGVPFGRAKLQATPTIKPVTTSTFQFPFQNFGMWNVELSFWEHLTPTMLKCIGMWNGKFHIPIPIPEFRDVECGIVLLRISHSNHAEVHWNVECGMENSDGHHNLNCAKLKQAKLKLKKLHTT